MQFEVISSVIREMHGIAAEISGAQTIIVPRLQHMGLVEKPSLFVEPVTQFVGVALR